MGCVVGNRTLCLCFTLIVFLAPGAVAKHSKGVQKLPFRLYRNHLIITTGSLGGLQNRNLLIDTGANPTVVDEALVHELGLKSIAGPHTNLKIVGGAVPTYYAILQSLDLGPIHRESLTVAIENLSLMQAQVGVRIDAIIGLDAIEPDNFEIDYESRKISFGDIRVSSPVPMLRANPFVVVKTQVNGATLDLAVDTGTPELVLFRDEMPSSSVGLQGGNEVPLSNVAGDMTATEVQVTNLKIGKKALNKSTAVLASAGQCCTFQGMLGVSATQFRRVSFDFQHGLLGLELPIRDLASVLMTKPCQASFSGTPCGHALLSGFSRP